MAAVNVNVAAVDCQKQVRSWQLFRSLIEFLIPTCNCVFTEEEEQQQRTQSVYSLAKGATCPSWGSGITGTIFGYRRGKVNFCIQTSSKSTNPILLLELAVPTAILAREMRGGVLRIALQSTGGCGSGPLLSSPAWTMYFNGRRVGYAVKRRPSAADVETLRLMDSVVEGAGIITGEQQQQQRRLHRDDDDLMYLRANFDRVCGSSGDSESFRLRDPNGSIGQELSIFFFRST